MANKISLLFLVLFSFLGWIGCKSRLFKKQRSSSSSFNASDRSGFPDGKLYHYVNNAQILIDNMCHTGSFKCPFKDGQMELVRLISPNKSTFSYDDMTLKAFLLGHNPDRTTEVAFCFNGNGSFDATSYVRNALPGNPNQLERCETSDGVNQYSFWPRGIYDQMRIKGAKRIKEVDSHYGKYEDEHSLALMTFPILYLRFTRHFLANGSLLVLIT